MRGQWLGLMSGTTEGLALVDIDDGGDEHRGHALYFPNDMQVPGVMLKFRVPNGAGPHQVTDVPLSCLDRQGHLLTVEQVEQLYPESLNPTVASMEIELTPQGLRVAYSTKFVVSGETHETSGTSVLQQYDATRPSTAFVDPDITSWDAFRAHVSAHPYPGHIYRGQPCLDRLRTSFHRAGRYDLVPFLEDDVHYLHRHITPITKHLFNLSDPDQLGAFYNLIQHHGYPTPLLDWTYSPFIAAFFAFRPKPIAGASKVRVYVFDKKRWCDTFGQFNRVTYLPPHFSVLELLGIENRRMIPQQALSTLTNIDDIETYIDFQEKRLSCTFLTAVDLDVSDRDNALRDLSLMGITAASLFPGLDGSCEAIKGAKFGYNT